MKLNSKVSIKIISEIIIEGYIIDKINANIILKTECIEHESEKIDLQNGIIRCQYILDEGVIYDGFVISEDPLIFSIDVEEGQCKMIYSLFKNNIELIKEK
jgi:hypothetical protein